MTPLEQARARRAGVPLVIEPRFALRAVYQDAAGEREEIFEEWLPIHSTTNMV